MLTQEPAPDPKCKFIISPFLTLPHLLYCSIFTRNAMPIVLLLQLMGGWSRMGVFYIYSGGGGGARGWVSSYSFCVFLLFLLFFLMFLYFFVSSSQSF